MIGTSDTQIIAGYSVPKYENGGPLNGQLQQIGKVNDAKHQELVINAVAAIQKMVTDAILEAKKQQRKSKEDWERTKNEQMNALKDESERQAYLFKTYVPTLRTIGVSKALLQTELNKLKLGTSFKDLTKEVEPKVAWGQLDPDWTKIEDGWQYQLKTRNVTIPLVHFLMGSAAYEIVIKQGEGVERPVYKKKLGPFSENTDYTKGPNEYVKDDNGFFTRRYAYGYKTLGACQFMMKGDEALKGRYAAKGADVKSIDADLRTMYTLPGDKKSLTKEEMLFVNQEKGSGDQQRGMCLSSSPNKTIHGNKGETFAFDNDTDKPNILLKVDLAQVPLNQEQLFNLYSQEAQTKTIGISGTKPKSKGGGTFTAAWAKEHTDTSTAKNREIFLLQLSKKQVVNQQEVLQEIERISKL